MVMVNLKQEGAISGQFHLSRNKLEAEHSTFMVAVNPGGMRRVRFRQECLTSRRDKRNEHVKAVAAQIHVRWPRPVVP